jgi:hypothetical protein
MRAAIHAPFARDKSATPSMNPRSHGISRRHGFHSMSRNQSRNDSRKRTTSSSASMEQMRYRCAQCIQPRERGLDRLEVRERVTEKRPVCLYDLPQLAEVDDTTLS